MWETGVCIPQIILFWSKNYFKQYICPKIQINQIKNIDLKQKLFQT